MNIPDDVKEVAAATGESEANLAQELSTLEAEEAAENVVPPGPTVYAITPLYDRILVQVEEAPDTVYGLAVPDAAKQKPQRGYVMEVGQGRIVDGGLGLRSLILKPGDRILFGMYSGIKIDLDSDGRNTALILREDEVLAVLEEIPQK